MNPLDWRGPEFLVFYGLFAAALLVGQWWTRRIRETANKDIAKLDDPYEIAYLRGGPNEALRVAIVNLLELQVVQKVGNDQLTSKPVVGLRLNALEQAVAGFYQPTRKAEEIFAEAKTSWKLLEPLAPYEKSLTNRGLLVSEEQKSGRRKDVLIALGIAILIGASKIAIGVSLGRPVAFLVLMLAITVIISLSISVGRLTPLGKQAVRNLRELFSGLESRARSYTEAPLSAAEVAMMAAVFGMPLIASTVHPEMRTLFPRATASTSSSGCGSSCGSSCGSGGGDGGGGGCGGSGCGGCGGGGD